MSRKPLQPSRTRYRFLYIDPGSNATLAWAATNGDTLGDCGLVRSRDGDFFQGLAEIPGATHKIVMERPMVYPFPRQKADPNDIVRIGICGGSAVGVAHQMGGGRAQVELIPPGTWKGQVPGDTMVDRIFDLLDDRDQMVFTSIVEKKRIPAGKLHNVIDAIGIWLYDTERL